jgi:hypothetical protein
MATFVIPLPNKKTIVVIAPNGDQIVPLSIYECECGCGTWFQPVEPTQLYLNVEHQQAAKNQRRRKTERRMRAN